VALRVGGTGFRRRMHLRIPGPPSHYTRPPMSSIDVDYRKWGGSQHYRWTARLLGEDAQGRWLGVLPGNRVTGPDGTVYHGTRHSVMLVPRGAWWVARYPETGRFEVYVDIAAPATWDGDRVEIVDLDLDVVRWREDRRVEVLDVDEFEEHRVRYGYPPDVVAHARAAADDIVSRVSAGDEPFGSAPTGWMEHLRTAAGGSPGPS